jgi:hypothetical protein
MGQNRSIEISVLEARHKIFNRLCSAYRRAEQDSDFGLRGYDVMVELAIPRNVFAEALDGFAVTFKHHNYKFASYIRRELYSAWRNSKV